MKIRLDEARSNRPIRSFTNEHDGGLRFVRGALKFPVAALLRDTNGRKIRRVDQAGGRGSSKMTVAPGDGGANGLGGVAPAVRFGSQHPADFGQMLHGRLQVAFVMGESNLADEFARGFVFDNPAAEVQERPMTNVAQKPCPGLFFGKGLSEVPGYDGVGPHRGGGWKVFETMAPEFEPFGFKDRSHADSLQSAG